MCDGPQLLGLATFCLVVTIAAVLLTEEEPTLLASLAPAAPPNASSLAEQVRVLCLGTAHISPHDSQPSICKVSAAKCLIIILCTVALKTALLSVYPD